MRGNITTMTRLSHAAMKLMQNLRGQDLIEYALLAASFAVAAGAIFPQTIAPDISNIFSKVTTILNSAP